MKMCCGEQIVQSVIGQIVQPVSAQLRRGQLVECFREGLAR